jgi:hypothetical protein
MKLPPRYITIAGVVLSLVAVLLSPEYRDELSGLLGENATAKLAMVGTLLSAVGRALFPPSDAPKE